MHFIRTFAKLSLLVLMTSLLLSCGDSSRNDQGVSFTFLGWFDPDDTSTGITGADVSLGLINGGESASNLRLTAAAGLSNNLSSQSIRVTRIDHDYEVVGSGVSIPSTSVAASGVVGPGSNPLDEFFPPDSTLPDGLVGQADTTFVEVPFLPADVTEYLGFEEANLPSPPYIIIVTSQAIGVTSAGHELHSNKVQLPIEVTPPILIQPSGPSSGGGGSSSSSSSASGAQESDGVADEESGDESEL